MCSTNFYLTQNVMLKKVFFCPECLDCVNHQETLIFFKNKISVLEAELWLKIKSIES